MCGRFALKNSQAVKAAFDLKDMPELPPRYNIAPSQDIAIIRADPDGRHLSLAHWGLIPVWAKAADSGYSTINARAETVDTKPSFRAPFKRHRFIPADGFYEWHEEGGIKIPHHIGRKDGAPFALAGLWDRWKGPQGEVTSCTITVTEANAFMKPKATDTYGAFGFIYEFSPARRNSGVATGLGAPYVDLLGSGLFSKCPTYP
jgi:putative SOS response-associated peptidase YedK